jgi:hypothetical protein
LITAKMFITVCFALTTRTVDALQSLTQSKGL